MKMQKEEIKAEQIHQKHPISTDMRTADFYVLLFFLLSFAGWVWEVTLYLVMDHVLVNSGVYRGPWLPIYGTGGLLLWFILHKYSQRPVVTFLFSMLICTVFEYIGSVFLELVWGVRWWDYSDRFLNIDGRVCLIGAICFGLFGMLLNCVLLPFYMKLYHKMHVRWRIILCGILLIFFVADVTYCAVDPNMSGSRKTLKKTEYVVE